MLRRLESCQVTPRQLAFWAHRNLGHDSSPAVRPFVDLDDMYDEAEYLGYSENELDAWTWQEAAAFLNGTPSPRRTVDWSSGPRREAAPNLFRRITARLRSR